MLKAGGPIKCDIRNGTLTFDWYSYDRRVDTRLCTKRNNHHPSTTVYQVHATVAELRRVNRPSVFQWSTQNLIFFLGGGVYI